jgi:hypothetical protein
VREPEKHAQVPWIFVKSQALVKSALHHLRGLDAMATGILVPATGLPRPVLTPQSEEQNACQAKPTVSHCDGERFSSDVASDGLEQSSAKEEEVRELSTASLKASSWTVFLDCSCTACNRDLCSASPVQHLTFLYASLSCICRVGCSCCRSCSSTCCLGNMW